MTSPPRDPDIHLDHVVIVGVGLIGGSIARAIKQRSPATRVTGLGRSRDRLLQVQAAGVIDAVATTPREIGVFDLAVVCTPVDRIVEDVKALAAVCPSNALITDAGSAKEEICRALADVKGFIGSHPMAGSEKGGWEHARDDLFQSKTCVVTPTGQPPKDVERICQFWQLLGMNVCVLPPDEHDQLVALTSHVPHAVAAILASMLTAEATPLASTGFRDTTRVASGDPDLWTGIFQGNRQKAAHLLRAFLRKLEQFAYVLEANDAARIREMLAAGKSAREAWLRARPDLDSSPSGS